LTDYRRASVAGATWFFTLGLAERRGATLLVENIDALGAAFRTVQARHPFSHGCGGGVAGPSALRLVLAGRGY
jgi:hypothetical protein